MKNAKRTAIRELIERLHGSVSVETAEKAFYDALDLERQIIATAYEAAMKDAAQGVAINGYEYYDKVFDNE